MLKKLICLLLVVSMLTVPAFALKGQVANPDDLPYIPTDGSPSTWAVPEIEAAAAAGLIPSLTGKPGYQDDITREQFAELAARLVQVCTGAEAVAPASSFLDCDNESVLFAADCGIVAGVGGGRFDPDSKATREEIAAMVARAIAYLEKDRGVDVTPKPASIASFADRGSVSDWAAESMGILAANGILLGTSDTTLSPQEQCTVEQSILLCCRVYQLFAQ